MHLFADVQHYLEGISHFAALKILNDSPWFILPTAASFKSSSIGIFIHTEVGTFI
jgi:hypothetical protein